MSRELVPSGTRIDFVGRWKACAVASSLAILIGLAAVPLRGLSLGVDFRGGDQILVRVPPDAAADESKLRGVLVGMGLPDAGVTRVGDVSEGLFEVRLPPSGGATTEQTASDLEQALDEMLGPVRIESVEFVGPRVGAELRHAALVSLGLSIALIGVYVAFRFAPIYAPGALVALVHDVLITASAFVVFGWEIDLSVLAALLTIVGYSLNDTIVIYDRIRENRALHSGADLAEVVNRSVNETLSRTVLTSGTTMLAVLALLVLGGRELRGFAAALAIGIVVGTYSSVYVASPLMLVLDAHQRRGRGAGGPPGLGREPPIPARGAPSRSRGQRRAA